MVLIAAQMAEKGEANADWLLDYALQLGEEIGEPAWEQLNQSGVHLSNQGQYAQAIRFAEAGLRLGPQIWGEEHPNIATSLNNLAIVFAATHRYNQALKLMQESAAIENRLIHQVFAASSERARLTYLQLFRGNFEGFLSLVSQHLHDSPAARKAALDLVLQRQALTAAALAALNQAIASGRYPHLTPQFQQLRELSDQIIHHTYTQPDPERLQQLQAAHDQLQQQLARQVPELQLQDQSVNCRSVALALPTGSTLIEFVCFHVWNFHATSQESEWQPPRYLAFILPAGQPDAVQMRDLGEAKFIDQLIQDVRQSASDSYLAVHSLDMGDDDEDEEVNQSSAALIQLRDAIFAPIRPYLCVDNAGENLGADNPGENLCVDNAGETPALLIAPDGNLNLLPFQLLPTDDTGEQLIINGRVPHQLPQRRARYPTHSSADTAPSFSTFNYCRP